MLQMESCFPLLPFWAFRKKLHKLTPRFPGLVSGYGWRGARGFFSGGLRVFPTPPPNPPTCVPDKLRSHPRLQWADLAPPPLGSVDKPVSWTRPCSVSAAPYARQIVPPGGEKGVHFCTQGAEPAVLETAARRSVVESCLVSSAPRSRGYRAGACGDLSECCEQQRAVSPSVGAVVGPGCGRAFARRWRSRRDAARGPESREPGQPRDAAEPGDSGDAAHSAGYEAKILNSMGSGA
uniref:Uncharacterized protein LOC109696396 n=1 Tax=Castor canadensis TaxID=51338 RepID=A0A8B7VTS2_CASCN|nr:uncharacterized protein LOC109696396 [Castor canadensis]